jgi:hypothetical protein
MKRSSLALTFLAGFMLIFSSAQASQTQEFKLDLWPLDDALLKAVRDSGIQRYAVITDIPIDAMPKIRITAKTTPEVLLALICQSYGVEKRDLDGTLLLVIREKNLPKTSATTTAKP